MKHTVTEHKLDNGAQGLIINVPGSDVVNVLVRFNSGYQFAPQATYEVPHVMEHLLATVTQKYPGSNQFMIEAEKNGAYVNATTSSRANGYVYECADFELDRMLDLLEEQLVRPLFAAEPLAAELSNVREELTRNTTQHGSVCNIRLAEQAFPGLALDYEARLAQLGDITLEAVEHHYRTTYTAANARFYVAGSFKDGGAAVVTRLQRLFDQLPQGVRLEPSRAAGRHVAAPIVTTRDIKQLYYAFDMYTGELPAAQWPAVRMLGLILAGGFGSRILGEARRRGLAYSVSAGGTASLGSSEFGFGGYVTPDNVQELFSLIAREFSDIAAGNVTTAELDAAKALGIGSTKRSHQTPGHMLGWYVFRYDQDEGVRGFYDYLAELQAVTPRQVGEVAAQFAASGRSGLSLLGDLDASAAESYAATLAPIWHKR